MFRFTDLIIFRFTRDCNLNCKYCFMTNKHEFKGEMITHEDFKQMVNEIIKQRLVNRPGNELDFVFHGGEALMIGKERFYQSAEYIKKTMDEAGIVCNLSMQTNGVLLDDEYAKIINKFHISIGLSFDGIAGSNKARDVKQQVFENKFEILNKNKVNYGFLVVGGKHNLNKIQKSRRYLERRGLHYKINYAEDMLTPGEDSPVEVDGETFFHTVYKPELERYIKTGRTEDVQMLEYVKRSMVDIFTFFEDIEHSGCGKLFCGSCIGMIGVNPDGTSHYCDRYDKEYDDTYVMNNLTDYDFLGLHQLKRAMDFNLQRHKTVLKTGCDTCYAKNICEGGCTAFHRSKYGVDGIDERVVCGLYKSFYSYMLENIERFVAMYEKHNIVIGTDRKFISIKDDMQNIIKDAGYEMDIKSDEWTLKIRFRRINGQDNKLHTMWKRVFRSKGESSSTSGD